MVSMKDIAKECGVSVATVSKTLNDYSDIGPETRKKVQEAATRLGYYPNLSARALKTKRTYNLGVLFVDQANSGLTHDFFARVLQSFKERAESRGYDITFTSNNISGRRTSYLEHCRYRGVDGVVIACIDFFSPDVQELIRSDLPVVTIDHVFDNRIAVVSDNVQGMHDLVEYVVSRGHSKIAYIHGEDSSVTSSRVGSFYRTLEQHGINIPEEYVRKASYRDVRSTADATAALLDLREPPTCILYPDDTSIIGGINVIRERDLRIPDDISICGYDGLFFSRFFSPELTTIWQDTDTIGKEAADKLIGLIEQPRTTLIERRVIPGKLVEGSSVKDLR